jgi:hypothetical protein
MPDPSEWARKEAIRLLNEGEDSPYDPRNSWNPAALLVRLDATERVALALDAALADGASKLRERIEKKAGQLESESAQAEGDSCSMTAFVTAEIAAVLRELLQEG